MSGRYIKVDFTSNWGDGLVCPVTMHACDADGMKFNDESMTHTSGPTLNGDPSSMSDDNAGTYWQSWNYDMPNFWKVDLGVSRKISKFKLAALIASRAIRNFTVSVSEDDENWNIILTGEGTETTNEQTWDCNDVPPIAAPVNYLSTRGRDRMRSKGISLGEKAIADGCFSFLTAKRDRLRTRGVSLEDAKPFVPPFNPESIEGLLAWVKADAFTDKSDGDLIASWPDQSGSGNDLTGVAGEQPTYKTGIVNDLPALLFDGVYNNLMSSTIMGVKTIIVVAKYTGAAFNDYDGLITGESNDIWFIGSQGGSSWYTAESPSIGRYQDGVPGSGAVTNAWHVFHGEDATPHTMKIRTGCDRGMYRDWDGYVAEILAYDSVLSETDRDQMTDYMKAKYGIA